jgi:glycosyltransferase involved in cell wall biosynthesis
LNILVLADPNLSHDQNWVKGLEREHSCFWLVRKAHYLQWRNSPLSSTKSISIISAIPDFSIVRFYQTLYVFIKLFFIIKRNNIDVFHIMYAEPNALWALGKTFFNIPTVLTTRGSDVLITIPLAFSKKDILNRMVSQLYKRAFRLFAFISCTSIPQINSVNRILYPVKKPVYLVRTGVQIKNFLSLAYKERLIPEPYIFMPRGMKPIYNHELILEAATYFSDELNTYTLVFVDSDRSDEAAYVNKLKRIAEDISLNVYFLPRQDQRSLSTLYKFASMVVMTPHSDGTPVSAIEAMAHKVPLIIGPLDYDKDIFSEEWVYILKNFSAKELADLVRVALQSSNTNMQELAYLKIEQLADTDFEMNKLLAYYNEHIKK